MHIKKFDARSGWEWVKRGWALFRQAPQMWLGIAFVYSLVFVALDYIPFVGHLVLTLITPMLLAGALLAAHDMQHEDRWVPPRGGLVERVREWLLRGTGQLLRAVADPTKTLPIMVIGTLALGVVVVLQIVGQLLHVGGAAIPAYLHGSVTLKVGLPALFTLLVLWAIKLILLGAVVYAVYLIALRDEGPLPALEYGLKACLRNPVAIAVVFAVVLLPYALVALIGVWALFLAGLLLLPWFVGSMYASGRDVYS